VKVNRKRKPVRRAKPKVKPWAEQYLTDHAVSVEFALRSHVKIYDDRILFHRICPLTGRDLDATSTRHKVPPIDTKTGKPMKFTRKRGGGNVLYFPSSLNWKPAFADTSVDFYIVESECSALALAERDFYAIGTGGKDGVFMAGTKKQKLHEYLSNIKWSGRRVLLAFDGDVLTNQDVRESAHAAAKLFAEAV